jgi:hypothetical protein
MRRVIATKDLGRRSRNPKREKKNFTAENAEAPSFIPRIFAGEESMP